MSFSPGGKILINWFVLVKITLKSNQICYNIKIILHNILLYTRPRIEITKVLVKKVTRLIHKFNVFNYIMRRMIREPGTWE